VATKTAGRLLRLLHTFCNEVQTQSAEARKMKLLSVAELFIECVRFFAATFTIKFEPKSRIAAFLAENPIARSEGWIVSNVLPMTTFENRPPMLFVVFIEASDPLLHWFLAEVRT
jgi:hypothetical protein